MPTEPDQVAGRLAMATGLVTLISVVSLVLFFVVGKPFGAINDWTVGFAGLLSGLLAFALRSPGRGQAAAALATGLALAGAAIVVIGAALVISGRTGFLLAGLMESLGFALIGVWLINLNRSVGSAYKLPRRLRNLGLAAGVVMAMGFLVAPGIVMGLDDADAAPAWIWLGFVGWLGIFALYPMWNLWLGRLARTGRSANGRSM
jgi:hypothetical protein